MIENEDTPTIPRPITQADTDEATTIRIAAATAHAPTAVATPPAHPYVSIDDLLTLQIASDPQISPNGTQIAFTVQRCNSEPDGYQHYLHGLQATRRSICANRRNDPDLGASMALWVLTLATGHMRRLTPERCELFNGLARLGHAQAACRPAAANSRVVRAIRLVELHTLDAIRVHMWLPLVFVLFSCL